MIQEALALHRQGNLAGAMERYVKVLQGDPQNADALHYIAVVAMQDGQYDEGIKLALRALAAGPPQARTHNMLGQAYLRLGKNREALEAFDRALAVDPDFADAVGNRAGILAELGHFQEAVSGFDRALKLRPDSVEDWCNRGAALQALGLAEEALASYDRAVLLAPGLPGAHFNRGNILRDIGQMEDAARPGGSPRGSTRFDSAEEAYGHAVDLNPKYDEAFLGRAIARLVRGDWEHGLADFEHRASVGEPTYAPLDHPRWKGEQLSDARLVLVSEGELADVIQLCRFAPAARGARLRRDDPDAQGDAAAALGAERRHDRDVRGRARARQAADPLAADAEPAARARHPAGERARGRALSHCRSGTGGELATAHRHRGLQDRHRLVAVRRRQPADPPRHSARRLRAAHRDFRRAADLAAEGRRGHAMSAPWVSASASRCRRSTRTRPANSCSMPPRR